jgi:hypothetical protein
MSSTTVVHDAWLEKQLSSRKIENVIISSGEK